MSVFGAIRSAALKVFQPSNRNILPTVSSNRLVANRVNNLLEQINKQLPPKPKRPLSGYNIFFQKKLNALKTQNPELNVKDMAKTIGNQWKSLDEVTKQEINNKMKNEKEEYQKLMKDWKNSLTDDQKKAIATSNKTRRALNIRRRIKSELKRLEYPTRNVSAFHLYIKQNIVKRDITSEPYKDVFKQYVSKWKTMSDEEKKPYIEAANADKARYLKEMEVWKQKMASPENRDSLDKLSKMKAFVSTSLSTKTVIKKPKRPKKPKKLIKAKKMVKPKVKVTAKKTKKPTKTKTKTTKISKSTDNKEN